MHFNDGRRKLLALAGVAAATTNMLWPLAARAQLPMPKIGHFSVGSRESAAPFMAATRKGLSEVGYVDGQNVAIEYNYANGRFDRLPAIAADLVARRVDVIVATTSAKEAIAATTTIPIVAAFPGDPVKAGLVASLNQPGGNLTGISVISFALGPKRLELLRELVPNAKIIAVLVNPSSSDPESITSRNELETTARAIGQQLLFVNASTEGELEPAFARMAQQGAGALLMITDTALPNWRNQIVALAARHAIPAIWGRRDFVEDGGLMSYGSDFVDAYRLVGVYVGKVLKGAKPADLPIILATKVEFVINMKTAKTLGLTFPLPLLGRADEVIE